ncbi:hypothetical protein M441DRAFT_25786 [Trichoderma asperellum CBS 433.97]|uniref:Transcription factor domain-containing protein n=2 Tax=Trichoderma asperellum TaxID=101201 RepID=A0A2T3ZB31_TRIA4|nr:hypothetical protein M441DRAFT_25786 [Trichoderma asperellum CBS 433.97]PTB41992.1 hypothetical protein M441DRAFT_25786 [Trichoderma asperellum CBS 433.97]
MGPKLGAAQGTSNPSSDQSTRSYSNVRFVTGSSSRRSAPSTEAQASTQREEPPLQAKEQPASLFRPEDDDIVETLMASSSSQSKTASPFAASHLPQSEWKDYFSPTHAASIKNETAALLHFQYNLAPWIEAGDLGSAFGTEIMLLAQRRRPVSSAISLAASSQLAKSSSTYGDSTLLQQETENALALEEPRVRRIGHALIAVGEVFNLSPSQWRTLSFFQSDESTRNTNNFSGFGEPLETLLRFHSRLDLAASLLTDQPPLTTLGFAMNHDPADRTLPLSTKSIYNACLLQLASCLQLLNGSSGSSVASPSPPFFMSATQEPLPSSPGSYFSSKWSSLWSNCQQWYHNRPVEMQPILEIRSVEAGQIDADNESSFPIPVYTSSIALQCNIVYHISSRLLLSRKPRLLRLSSRQRHLSSLSWHAQQIAGTATRNEFAEQWDPILIAGLLWIARDMTHPSQQESLLSCFTQISSSTGINLDEEIRTLKDRWNVSHARGHQLSG